MDAEDRVVGQALRGDVYAGRLRHRCVFVLARDAEDHAFLTERELTGRPATRPWLPDGLAA